MKYLILAVLLALPSVGKSDTVFGRYVGVLKHEKIFKDQVAKLDFVTSRTNGNKLELMAVLSLYFGDFGSSEYLSYHFDSVSYNLISGELVFDQSDQELTLQTMSFKDGRLQARVRSNQAGIIGELDLTLNGSAKLASPVIGILEGEYLSDCGGKKEKLQIQTYRSSEELVRLGNPFGAYQVKAQQAEQMQDMFGKDDTNFYVTNEFTSGTYNFFEGQLTLFGKLDNLFCQVDDDKLSCGECVYQRTKVTYETLRPRESIPKFNTSARGASTSISGTYTGYVHHENLNTYQAGSLSIVTYQKPNNEGAMSLFLSATANLNFVGKMKSDTLSYRFEEREFDLLNPTMVLSRPKEDVDAVIKITSIGDGKIVGEWYSITFGKVGTFYFRKDGKVELPGEASIMKQVGGSFESDSVELKLNVRLGQSPINTENPFFPLLFGGYTYYKAGFSPRRQITGGSYDFYTGKIALEADAWSTTGVIEGDTINVRWPSVGLWAVLQPFTLNQFLPQ